MKFIYKGKMPIKDVDLVLGGVLKPGEPIVNGRVFEVPDDNKLLIQRVKVNGVYEPYIEPKKVTKPKKSKKKDEEKEDLEEE